MINACIAGKKMANSFKAMPGEENHNGFAKEIDAKAMEILRRDRLDIVIFLWAKAFLGRNSLDNMDSFSRSV